MAQSSKLKVIYEEKPIGVNNKFQKEIIAKEYSSNGKDEDFFKAQNLKNGNSLVYIESEGGWTDISSKGSENIKSLTIDSYKEEISRNNEKAALVAKKCDKLKKKLDLKFGGYMKIGENKKTEIRKYNHESNYMYR